MMPINELCTREVVCASGRTSLSDAARLMREHHVGSLVIVEETARGREPRGLLTDRDISVAAIAREVDPQSVTVADVMSADVVCVRQDQGVTDALKLMRKHGVRRIVVIDSDGSLVGLLSMDDVLHVLSQALGDISQIIEAESAREARSRL